MRVMLAVALSVAGSDPSGGAGIQADLKTFQTHGVYGTAAVSLLTVQHTQGVLRVELVAPELLSAQLDALLSDLPPRAAKTGALGAAAHVEAVARCFSMQPTCLVVDPVLASTSGAVLLDVAGQHALCTRLLPLATLVTPNLIEAALLSGVPLSDDDSVRDAARAIADLGARAVLIKGGHRDGDALDLLYEAGTFHEFSAPRIERREFHGLGCALSAAITARLALGESVVTACAGAKEWLTRAMLHAPHFPGRRGPVHHAEPASRAHDSVHAER